ncbi:MULTISPECIES: helix-turn-helix transcriptional regulator [Aminobacterium]|uniref:helix-turn-helix transcriptional regulator n=1 Tax=Aminobacterium TaxID=81466 RepID=UPI00257E1037|nr:AlpA family phage regulatory protein [Aminobacterium sp. UBA4987]
MEGDVTMPEFGFLRLPDVLKIIPVSSATWYNGIREGRFPKGIRITGNTVGWRVQDIKALVRKIEEEASENA